MKQVLCIGSVTADVILQTVSSLPEPGTLQAVQKASMHVGGCAANAALDLAALGVSVKLCCRVGNDTFGDFVYGTMKEHGIATEGIKRDKEVMTTLSNVLVNEAGERSFLYYPGSTSCFCEEDISDGFVEEADIVFAAGAMLLTAFDGEPCARFFKRCRELGKYTVMDTAWDFEAKWGRKTEEVYPWLDLFMPSYEEAMRLSKEQEVEKIAEYFSRAGVRNVIIKLGSRGAYFLEENGCSYFLPASRGIVPVDTTGAGDAFCAGFLAGLANDLSFRECGRLANAAGAHCIMAVGASAGMKSMDELQEYIKSHANC